MSTGDQYRSGRPEAGMKAQLMCRWGALRFAVAMCLLLHRLAAAGFVSDLVALLVVDAISWHRTRGIRTGSSSSATQPTSRGPPPNPVVGSRYGRASPTTWLAGAAGLWSAAYGATTPSGIRWTSRALIAAGGFILLAGLIGRVRTVRAERAGVVVHYAGRRRLTLPWAACQELRPPRSFVGGWRVIGTGGSGSLMPSDLLGNEWLLAAIVDSARLSFSGRSWVKEPSEQIGD
jgi:hypothetical protein